MSKKAPSTLKKRLTSLIGISIGLAGMAFVVRTVVTKWDDVKDAYAQFDPVSLLGSLALALGALCIIGSTWALLLRERGQKASISTSLSWYFTGQLGKYVPGGIWAIVGRAEMAVRGGIPRSDAYVTTGISMTTTYLASTVVIAIGSLLSWTLPIVGTAILASLVVGFVLYAQPRVHAVVLQLSRKLLPNGLVLTDTRVLLRSTMLQIPAWILMSLSTSISASAFDAEIGIAHMCFITATSWLIGFVAVGVPGGIGVRESVFTALATSTVGAPLAVSIALASRVVFIFADITGALVSTLIVRRQQRDT